MQIQLGSGLSLATDEIQFGDGAAQADGLELGVGATLLVGQLGNGLYFPRKEVQLGDGRESTNINIIFEVN